MSESPTALPVELLLDQHRHPGLLGIPDEATGLVLFVHGSGSSHLSPRNNQVAELLRDRGLATLLFDLLTEAEDIHYANRFDIELLTHRLLGARDWIGRQTELADLPLGFFGASTGAAAALSAAAREPGLVRAIVSRGGRPDLAADELAFVQAPTLLIVGGADDVVLELNRQAREQLGCDSMLQIVAGATHLFEEPGALDQVATLAADWFLRYLRVPRDRERNS